MPTVSVDDRRARFRLLHERDQLLLMPNPWDVGSAKLLASLGFEALATTSSGFAWSVGKHDHGVDREELVIHVQALAAAVEVPLSVDSEHCFPQEPGGVEATARLLVEAGASGFSIEDHDPASGAIVDLELAVERVAAVARVAHATSPGLVLTARAERGVDTSAHLDEVIARLVRYREAGADVLFAPALARLDDIARVVDAVGAPLNVIARPGGPSVGELAQVGVRRVSTGGLLARAAYGALVAAARELLDTGTSAYAARGATAEDFASAFGPVAP